MPLRTQLVYVEPSTLHVHARRRLPLSTRLRNVAESAQGDFTTLWHGLFLDVRAQVKQSDMVDALQSSNMLPADTLMRDTWRTYGEQEARNLLPVLVRDVLYRAAETAHPDTEQLVGQSFPLRRTQRIEHDLMQYVGTQITNISDTTLETVRTILQRGWSEGQGIEELAQRLRGAIGLTPRQESRIEGLEEQLSAEGHSERDIAVITQQARDKALNLRAQNIARTETIDASARGAHAAMQQAIDYGLVDPEEIRRFWLPADDACPICAQIPEMNPDGVGPEQPFQTPLGPILYPTAHPHCRCTVTVQIGAASA